MNVIKSRQILILIYGLLSLLYLTSSINCTLENSYRNRFIGATIACIYFFIMTIGLIKFHKIFSFISTINFIIGVSIVAYINIIGLPNLNIFLISSLLLGILGIIISINSIKQSNKS